MIGLINYGSGNVHAIANLHNRANINYIMSSDPTTLKSCNKYILPGVGAFDETMTLLQNNNLIDFLNHEVLVNKKPILGVCVGMQILVDSSEEGTEKGFGWIPGKVKRLDPTLLTKKPHLPHLGWNSIKKVRDTPLLRNIDCDHGFYFLHSYYLQCEQAEHQIASTTYGKEFTSVVNANNVYGVQFHPEKSHENGINLFKNFNELC